jgi:prophage DNA circulation protein
MAARATAASAYAVATSCRASACRVFHWRPELIEESYEVLIELDAWIESRLSG